MRYRQMRKRRRNRHRRRRIPSPGPDFHYRQVKLSERLKRCLRHCVQADGCVIIIGCKYLQEELCYEVLDLPHFLESIFYKSPVNIG